MLSFLAALGVALPAQTANLIVNHVDPSQVRSLANHHPLWANAGNDAGLLPSNRMLDSLTLVLQRSPQQEQSFEQLLANQQDPASPDYHRWLTPIEVGDRFGLSTQDIDTLTGWLQSQGLHVNWVSSSRILIGFGGTAADIGRAFQTELHTYNVNGLERMSVSSDLTIPEALAPAIKGIRGLYDLEERPAHHMGVMLSDSPEYTNGTTHFVTPADFNTIYSVPSSLTGAGQTIGIVGRSRVNLADLSSFNSRTGSGAIVGRYTEVVPVAYGGVDPGAAATTCSTSPCSPPEDQGEATLDVMRAGSVAAGANLLLAVATSASGGIGVDAEYLVDTTPVPAQVMSISFGACESAAGAPNVDFWDNLFKSAAAEGISVFVSSGDAGASGCDANFQAPPASPQANSPNYICSSSYTTCVGGTEFADTANPSAYWNSSNASNLSSALGYIPEGGWNEATTTSVAASGGGVSLIVPTPSWQTGTGVPTAKVGRYTPDVSFSAAGHDGYFGCYAAAGASCVSGSNGGYYFEYFSGTSASAPGMAGVAALLDQKFGAPQGNLNPQIYQLAASVPAAFHDTTVATSGVSSCLLGTPSMCNNTIPSPTSLTGGQTGFLVTTGYDLVTGLGSLDVSTFINSYTSKLIPAIAVTPSPASITTLQGTTVTVTASSSASAPTGTVVLSSGSYSSAAAALVGGSAKIAISAGVLAPGTDTLTAKYTPDTAGAANYAIASGSGTVTVSLVNPTVSVSFSSAKITTAQSLTVTVAVSGGNGAPTATGSVSLNGGGYSGTATLGAGSATFQISPGMLNTGTYALTANYIPDTAGFSTYNYQSGSNTVTVTATASTTPTVTVTPAASTTAKANPLQVTISVSGGHGNPTPTGSITLNGGGFSSASVPLGSGTASVTIPAGTLTVGSDTLIALYAPDTASATTYNNATGSTTVSVLNPAKSTPIVTVSPQASSVTTAQTLAVIVTVSGTNGYPTTTGSVVLTGGGYTSATATLGSGNSATIVIPAGALALGSDSLTASYTPDTTSSTIFFSATGVSSPVTVTAGVKTTPTVTVTPAASSITTADALSVDVKVASSSGTPTGTVVLAGGGYTSAATPLSAGSFPFYIPAGSLAAGTDSLTATYTPDTNSAAAYTGASGSNSVTVTVLKIVPTLTITPSPASPTTAQPFAVTVTIGGGSGNPKPTGSVSLTGGGLSLAATASGGVATFNIAAGSLPSCSFVLTATYTPDSASSSTYKSAAASSSITITAGPNTTPSVTVTPPSGIVTTSQAFGVSVVVMGNPAPTGTVVLAGRGYSSAATTLKNGGVTFALAAGALAVGTDTLVATYSPDAASTPTYTAATGSSPVTVIAAPTATTGSASAVTASSATLAGSVNPNGADTHAWFLFGTSNTLSGATQTASQDLGSATSPTAVSAGIAGLSAGTQYYYQLVAQNSAGTTVGTINALTTTAAAVGSFTIGGSTVTVTAGATTGNTSTITVTPSGGFTGNVALTAAVTSSPAGAVNPPTFSFGSTSPVSITGTTAGTATLTVSTTAPKSPSCTADNRAPGSAPWYAGGGAVLACLLLFGIPARRRSWRALVGMVVLLAALAAGAVGCGGTSGGGIACPTVIAPGTTAGQYTVTVTGTSGAIVQSGTFTLTVQ